MSRAVTMVEVQFQELRGVSSYLFAGTFTAAKRWARSVAGDRDHRCREARWTTPGSAAYAQSKAAGKEIVFADVAGPVAFRWIDGGCL